MTVYLSNLDGDGKTNEEGHYRLLSRVLEGQVLLPGDIEVTESDSLGMSVDVQPGDYRIENTSGYSYMGWIDDVETVVIASPDVANPRISAIVLYIDKGETTSPSPPNNPGIAKLVSIDGTPSSTPVSPSDITIQSAVGAGNPFIRLSDVRVDVGVTQITNSNITDFRERIKIIDEVIETSNLIQFVGPLLYPIGSVYTNATDNTNPGTLFGFGTWTAVSEGRVLVGLQVGDDDFGTSMQIGGSKTVTLTEGQMPSHSHIIDPPLTGTSTNGYHSHGTSRDPVVTSASGNSRAVIGGGGQQLAWSTGLINPDGNHSHYVDIAPFNSQTKGSSQAHANIQPYMTVYMWRRTA